MQVELLARAGVGHLRIVDRDFVEESNLQRQLLFCESDAEAALPKAIAARKRIAEINSQVEVEAVVADLDARNADELLGGVSLILDATDNFETRYLINDYAVREGIAWIHGAAVASYGLKFAIQPGTTACYRCVYPDPPSGLHPTCESEGVLAPVTATIAALQVADALQLLATGKVPSRITRVDVWSGEIRQTAAPARDPQCPCCEARVFSYLDGARRAPISLCGRNAVQIHEKQRPLDLQQLASRLGPETKARANEFALRAWIESYEVTVFPDGRAIVKGTTDTAVARSLYSRFIGL